MASRAGGDDEAWGRTLGAVDAIVVITDAAGVILMANDAARAVSEAGRPLIGSPFVRAGWFTNMPASSARADTAVMQAQGGAVVRCEIDVRGSGGARHPYEFTLFPAVDAAGTVSRLMITGLHAAIGAQTESSRNAAFMHRVDNAIGSFDDPQRILDVATRMLVEQMGASRVAYADIDEAAGSIVVRHDHCDSCQSIIGTWALADLSAETLAGLRRGESLVLRDLEGQHAATALLRARGGAAAIC